MTAHRRALGLLWAAALAACLVSGRAGADLLERTDPQREVDLGRQVARQVELMMPVSTDKMLQARVERVGAAVVEQLENKVYPYQFKVLAVPEYNAFAIPGGFIYVCEGLLDRVADDNELAFVLGHEVSHVSHRHWARRTEDMKGVSILGALAAEAIGGDSDLVAALASELVYLRYSRDDENEADESAMEYMWRAGFDPAGAEGAMQQIVRLEKGESTPRYLRNHPPARDRLAGIQRKEEELKSRPPPAGASSPAPETIGLAELAGKLPAVELSGNPWFPLAVGNRWTYSAQQEGGGKTSYTIEITGEIPVEKGAVYRAVVSFGKSSIPCQMLTADSQVWRRGRAGGGEGEWQVEYVTDLGAGQVLAEEGWEYRVVGTESVSVPCGTFAEARRVRKSRAQPPMTVDMWLVRGVGLVKRVVAETSVTEALTHYQVAPAPGVDTDAGK